MKQYPLTETFPNTNLEGNNKIKLYNININYPTFQLFLLLGRFIQ